MNKVSRDISRRSACESTARELRFDCIFRQIRTTPAGMTSGSGLGFRFRSRIIILRWRVATVRGRDVKSCQQQQHCCPSGSAAATAIHAQKKCLLMPPRKKGDVVAEVYDSVTDGLKQLYKTKIRPVEEVQIATQSTVSTSNPNARSESTQNSHRPLFHAPCSRVGLQIWRILLTDHE